MKLAVAEARRGVESGEAPIGCVVLNEDGALLGAGHNTLLQNGNPTLHAEMNAFAQASDRVDSTGASASDFASSRIASSH